MYLEKQNGHSVIVQAIFFLVFFFPGTGGVVFTILLDVVEAGYMCHQWQGHRRRLLEAVGIQGVTERSQSASLWY